METATIVIIVALMAIGCTALAVWENRIRLKSLEGKVNRVEERVVTLERGGFGNSLERFDPEHFIGAGS